MKSFFIGGAFVSLVTLSGVLSLLHPWGDVRAEHGSVEDVLAGSDASPEVRRLLIQKCGDCHSTLTHWPPYSRLAPGSWLMEKDVAEARTHMNLSHWSQYDAEVQTQLLGSITAEVRSGEMPLRKYLILHPGGQLSDSERQMIYSWSRAERKRLRALNQKQDH